MSMPSALLAVLLAAATPVTKTCLPDPPGTDVPPGAEAYIRKAEAHWAASVARDEASFLKRFTSDGFVAVFDGEILSRAALIAGAEKRPPGAATNTLESLRVHLFGSTAVAEGSEIWSDTASARRRRIVWSDLWVHCRGSWRLVTATSIGSSAH